MTIKSNQIKQDIMRKFFFNDKLRYNEIWDKKICSSSNFDYHLKQLIEENILIKNNEQYVLTSEGTKILTSIDSVSMTDKKKPVPCAFILVENEKKEILLSIRAKQPFLNHLNIPGGKIEHGVFSQVEAKRELLEETGLECDIELKMITEKITINKDENESVEHHIIGYFYIGKNPKGKFLNETREGKNIWITVDEMKNYMRFPDLDFIVPHMISGKGIKIAQITRYRENSKFVDMKINEIN